MKKYFPLVCLSLLAFALIFTHHGYRPHHSYVQGGNNGPAGNVTTITCQPNSVGSVTAGNIEVAAGKANGGVFTGISSTRVTTWHQVSLNASAAYWWGIVASSGAETISETLSPTNLATAVCGEYSTNTADATPTLCFSCGSLNITTTKTNADLVCAAGDGTGLAFTGTFTLRQTGTLLTGPNGKLLLGDVNEAVAGTYTCPTNGVTSAAIVLADFYTATPANVPRHR
jgi:hypothetical protein